MYTVDPYFSNLTIRHIGFVELFCFRGTSILDEGSHLKLGIDSCLIIAIAQQEILSVELAKFWYRFVVFYPRSMHFSGHIYSYFQQKGLNLHTVWGKPQGFN